MSKHIAEQFEFNFPVPKKRHVVGFMFNETGSRVVTILKQKPRWMAGLLNGVGGKVENGEDFMYAMIREFKEETGVTTIPKDWKQFLLLSGSDYEIAFFKGFSAELFDAVRTMEAEVIVRAKVRELLEHGTEDPIVANLRWILPMALTDTVANATEH